MARSNKISEENQKLQLAINELKVLNEIATTISSIQPVDKVIDQIVIKCIKHLNAEEGAVSLLDQQDQNPEFQTMIRRQDLSKERVPIKLDTHLTGWMIKNQKSLLSNNIRKDERFHVSSKTSELFRSILCVPLMVKGELTGYLAVFNKKDSNPFTEEDRRLLTIIGSQSAQVIENARLYEEEKALISLQEEMRLAKDIQSNLLPDGNPQIDGYQICAANIPAKAVGGDYFDFIDLADGRLGFCVGDITGKGMPAALLMANLQATLRSQTLIFGECNKCLQSTNKLLYRNTESSKFATLFYGVLDAKSDRIQYCNGGHDHPLLITQQGILTLESTGMLLGVIEDTMFENAEISMDSGDLLVIYSDGITESMNRDEEEFGVERLKETVRRYKLEKADVILNKLIEEVKLHAQNTSQSDDITLMIIKKE